MSEVWALELLAPPFSPESPRFGHGGRLQSHCLLADFVYVWLQLLVAVFMCAVTFIFLFLYDFASILYA